MTDTPNPIDPGALRNALGRFATGVAIVTTVSATGKTEGLTINSFASVSLDPPLVLWSLRKDAPSHPAFVETGRFTVNILAEHQDTLSSHFARPHIDKFAVIEHFTGDNGCPRFDGAIAHFDCETTRILDGGDHSIFLGAVTDFSIEQGEPLLFSGGRYCRIAPHDGG